MKTLTKYHVCNHCVSGEKTFQNILIGPGELPGLSRNGPPAITNLWPISINEAFIVNNEGKQTEESVQCRVQAM